MRKTIWAAAIAAAIAYIAAAALLLTSAEGRLRLPSDDAYIYLGYVKQFLHGQGLFSYNTDDHAFGLTGVPFYYLLVLAAAPLRLLGLDRLAEAEALILVAFGMGTLLTAAIAAMLAALWRGLTDLPGHPTRPAWTAGLLALLCLGNGPFLWGLLSGLENPLSALACLALLRGFTAAWPPFAIGLAAAVLCTCRPETLPFALLIAGVGGWTGRPDRWRGAFQAVGAGAALAVALYLPAWAVTGNWYPNSLGGRVGVPILAEPWRVPLTFAMSFVEAPAYWLKPWIFAALFAVILLAPRWRQAAFRPYLAAAALILLYAAFRAGLGLTTDIGMGVADRYISYLWPVEMICLITGLIGPMQRLGGRISLWSGANVCALALAAHGATAGADDLIHWRRHSEALGVAPSLWMAERIPPGTRIIVEPAGAIRLFTDFYIVDAVGLTTNHLREFAKLVGIPGGSVNQQPLYLGAIKWYGIAAAWDYPARVSALKNPTLFTPLMDWLPPDRQEGYRLVLYRTELANFKPGG